MTNAAEQSIKARIKKIASIQSRPFNVIWDSVILERWLVRLSKSPYHKQFIFKGAMCLARYIDINRQTRDLDFLISDLAANQEDVTRYLTEISEISVSDGFTFDKPTVELLAHTHMKYPGYTATIAARLGGTRTKIQLDVGVGDAVKPENLTIDLAAAGEVPLFEKEIALWAYPVESIFAEKFQTALMRGEQNSRMKDYQDMLLLIRSKRMPTDQLVRSINSTFKNRNTIVRLLVFDSSGAKKLQTRWDSHLKGLEKSITSQLPESISSVISEINDALWEMKIVS